MISVAIAKVVATLRPVGYVNRVQPRHGPVIKGGFSAGHLGGA